MKLFLFIGAGGFLGSVLRYSVARLVQNRLAGGFPYGTLVVNIVGCFLIGMLFTLFERVGASQSWQLFFITGLCGGFTTFSAFSADTLHLLQNGHVFSSILYIGASVLLGVLATLGGIYLFRLV